MTIKSFNHRPLLLLVVVILLTALAGFAPGSNSAEFAKPPEGYTAASIEGTWAYTITGGSNMASAAGIAVIDKLGTASGPFVMNAPALDGGRLVVPGTFSGIITQYANGTGIYLGTTSLADGSTVTATIDLVITQARVHGRLKTATEMFGMQREANFGLFWTYLFKRLPD
jgi:hypothetical protein